MGVTGSGDGAGAVEAADDDAEEVAAFCTAPDEPAVVDEHPAIAAVASTNPTVSSFSRVLTSFSILERWGCESSRRLFDEGYPGKVPGKVTMFTRARSPRATHRTASPGRLVEAARAGRLAPESSRVRQPTAF